MASGPVLGLWSVILEPGQSLDQQTRPGIQITNICLDEEITGNDRCVVKMKYADFEDSDDEDSDEELDDDESDDSERVQLPKIVSKEAVIAILTPGKTEQVSVSITVPEEAEVVEFTVSGKNKVHLVGHYFTQEFDEDPYGTDEYDSEDESIDSDLAGGSDDDSDIDMSALLANGDDDSDDDSARFEEIPELKAEKAVKKADKAEKTAEAATKKADAAAVKSLKRPADDEADESADLSGLSKNQRKKLAKKMKKDGGEAAPAAAAAPAPAAAPAAKKDAAQKKKPEPQTLAGGLVIEDAKLGDGPVARAGKKVSMRYIGKLQNGKVFDSNTKGSPLTFTLGRGEVISGWDKGVDGLKVGGERRLTIPPAMAYGKKGVSGIPPNSTLIFDVKLLSVK